MGVGLVTRHIPLNVSDVINPPPLTNVNGSKKVKLPMKLLTYKTPIRGYPVQIYSAHDLSACTKEIDSIAFDQILL